MNGRRWRWIASWEPIYWQLVKSSNKYSLYVELQKESRVSIPIDLINKEGRDKNMVNPCRNAFTSSIFYAILRWSVPLDHSIIAGLSKQFTDLTNDSAEPKCATEREVGRRGRKHLSMIVDPISVVPSQNKCSPSVRICPDSYIRQLEYSL